MIHGSTILQGRTVIQTTYNLYVVSALYHTTIACTIQPNPSAHDPISVVSGTMTTTVSVSINSNSLTILTINHINHSKHGQNVFPKKQCSELPKRS